MLCVPDSVACGIRKSRASCFGENMRPNFIRTVFWLHHHCEESACCRSDLFKGGLRKQTKCGQTGYKVNAHQSQVNRQCDCKTISSERAVTPAKKHECRDGTDGDLCG